MKKIVNYICVIMSSIVFANYNTYFIGLTELRLYEKIVIFTLFLLMGFIIFSYIFIKKQLLKKLIKGDIRKFVIAFCIILSIGVVKVFENIFIIANPQKVNLSITALAEKSEESLGNEVWISDIKKGSSKINLSEIHLTEGWLINQGALLASSDKPSTINILLYADKDISVDFVKHNYSGKVKIEENDKEKIVDLYDANGGTYTYKIQKNGEIEYYILRIAEITYLTVVLFIVFSLYMIKKSKSNKILQKQ